jgi:DNA-binding NarL/FixJ family response regulator
MTLKKISVLLADDHTVVRQGLKAMLTAEADMEVVGEAENGEQAVKLAKQIRPDVVVMDISMPLMNGLKATRQILRNEPEAKVLILSSYNDDECVNELLKAGATGFLMKQNAAGDLAPAIRHVKRGNQFLSPAIVQRIRQQRNGELLNGNHIASNRELTAREIEVLKIIADGLSNRKIATVMGISIKTVEKHRQQVMNKLNIHEVAGLTRYALSKGLVERKGPEPAIGL